MLPCHASPAGARLAALLRGSKSIATLGASTARSDVATLPFDGFTGLRGTVTGLWQAASLDGRSGFWVAGIANSRYGVRHVAPGSANATRVNIRTVLGTTIVRWVCYEYQLAKWLGHGVAQRHEHAPASV